MSLIAKLEHKAVSAQRLLSFEKESYSTSNQSWVQYTLRVKITVVHIILELFLDYFVSFYLLCVTLQIYRISHKIWEEIKDFRAIIIFLPYLVAFPVYLQRHAFLVSVSCCVGFVKTHFLGSNPVFISRRFTTSPSLVIVMSVFPLQLIGSNPVFQFVSLDLLKSLGSILSNLP